LLLLKINAQRLSKEENKLCPEVRTVPGALVKQPYKPEYTDTGIVLTRARLSKETRSPAIPFVQKVFFS
jgi:hypothetical protein